MLPLPPPAVQSAGRRLVREAVARSPDVLQQLQTWLSQLSQVAAVGSRWGNTVGGQCQRQPVFAVAVDVLQQAHGGVRFAVQQQLKPPVFVRVDAHSAPSASTRWRAFSAAFSARSSRSCAAATRASKSGGPLCQ